ncbi:MAG: hypothetical protein ACK5HO_12645 [Pseudomonadota bacterium]|jgi:hypothetical protein
MNLITEDRLSEELLLTAKREQLRKIADILCPEARDFEGPKLMRALVNALPDGLVKVPYMLGLYRESDKFLDNSQRTRISRVQGFLEEFINENSDPDKKEKLGRIALSIEWKYLRKPTEHEIVLWKAQLAAQIAGDSAENSEQPIDPGSSSPGSLNDIYFSSSMNKNRLSLQEYMRIFGTDESFEPEVLPTDQPTDAPPGSVEKIEVLRRRVEIGAPLWHPKDRLDYTDLTGAVLPR